MRNSLIQAVESKTKVNRLPDFKVGDTVDVHVRIVEGEKERVQVFSGLVISRRGEGSVKTFIVRRIVAGEGVERVFPVNSPAISKIDVVRRGHTRRSKLYYLRDRVGKATRLRDTGEALPTTPVEPEEQPAAEAEASAAEEQGDEAAASETDSNAPEPAAKA